MVGSVCILEYLHLFLRVHEPEPYFETIPKKRLNHYPTHPNPPKDRPTKLYQLSSSNATYLLSLRFSFPKNPKITEPLSFTKKLPTNPPKALGEQASQGGHFPLGERHGHVTRLPRGAPRFDGLLEARAVSRECPVSFFKGSNICFFHPKKPRKSPSFFRSQHHQKKCYKKCHCIGENLERLSDPPPYNCTSLANNYPHHTNQGPPKRRSAHTKKNRLNKKHRIC